MSRQMSLFCPANRRVWNHSVQVNMAAHNFKVITAEVQPCLSIGTNETGYTKSVPQYEMYFQFCGDYVEMCSNDNNYTACLICILTIYSSV